ncbi:MAG: hypothetical protein LUD17_16660 [Bacteroidales bacterium]|nr:hypothetical protein [Bacteroidales bacterium]
MIEKYENIFKLSLSVLFGAMGVSALAATPSVAEVLGPNVIKTMTVNGQKRTFLAYIG